MEIETSVLTAEAARQKAAALETQGMREAAILETAGVREAAILRTEGQRTINLVWETTQRLVALSVTGAALLVACMLSVFGKWLGSIELQIASMVFLYGVANLVTGFYFGRTNHARTGGIGGEFVREDR